MFCDQRKCNRCAVGASSSTTTRATVIPGAPVESGDLYGRRMDEQTGDRSGHQFGPLPVVGQAQASAAFDQTSGQRRARADVVVGGSQRRTGWLSKASLWVRRQGRRARARANLGRRCGAAGRAARSLSVADAARTERPAVMARFQVSEQTAAAAGLGAGDQTCEPHPKSACTLARPGHAREPLVRVQQAVGGDQHSWSPTAGRSEVFGMTITE